MTRMLLRLALAAAIAVGVVAMHSFGHAGGHGDGGHRHGAVVSLLAQQGESAHTMDHGGGHAMPAADADTPGDPDAVPLLALLSAMVCAAILIRFSLDFWRALWTRLVAFLLPVAAPVRARRERSAFLPPGPIPTSLRLNRITVLRI